MTTQPRTYRGQDAETRRAERRRRLLDAALELFGTRGYAATTIQDVCAAAGVTARHLYDDLGGREELLLALYEDIVAGHLAHVAEANAAAPLEDRLRAGTAAALEAWAADERRARVAFVEVVGVSPAVEARRHAVIEGYAAFVAAELAKVAPRERDYAWAGRALVGATIQVFESWLGLEDRPPLDDLVAEMTLVFGGVLDA
jgi:AcrR family transcriptional regulator